MERNQKTQTATTMFWDKCKSRRSTKFEIGLLIFIIVLFLLGVLSPAAEGNRLKILIIGGVILVVTFLRAKLTLAFLRNIQTNNQRKK